MTVTNSLSHLLTPEENQRFVSLLGNRKRAVATAVVQLFFAQPPYYNAWSKIQCGVASLTKDANRRSFYIQVYDLATERMVWEQEIYDSFSYNDSSPFFHFFEANDHPAGLNFADPNEASTFASFIASRVRTLQKNHRPPAALAVGPPSPRPPTTLQGPQRSPNPAVDLPDSKSLSAKAANRKAKGSKARKRITKEDIGMPTDFRHEHHVGFDTKMPDAGTGEEADLLSKFMKLYGVDPKNVDFVRDFVADHGGFDRLKREMQAPPTPGSARRPPQGPPPPPAGGAPRPGAPPPPPPPTGGAPRPGAPPPPPPPGVNRRQNCPLPPPPGPPQRPGPGRQGPPPPPPAGRSAGPPPPPPPPGGSGQNA